MNGGGMKESDRDRLDGRALQQCKGRLIELAALLVCIAIAGYFVWRMLREIDI